MTRHTEATHTTEEEIPDYEDHTHTKIATRSPYGIDEVVPGSYPGYNGHEPEITTKWYHPKATDNRVVPQDSEFFATVIGM